MIRWSANIIEIFFTKLVSVSMFVKKTCQIKNVDKPNAFSLQSSFSQPDHGYIGIR